MEDDTPRMTAADADARFAALVSEYRGAKGRRGMRPESRRAQDSTLRTLVVVVVFCIGVGCGAIWSRKPFTALLIGIPLILLERLALRRWQGTGRDD